MWGGGELERIIGDKIICPKTVEKGDKKQKKDGKERPEKVDCRPQHDLPTNERRCHVLVLPPCLLPTDVCVCARVCVSPGVSMRVSVCAGFAS